MNPAVMTILTLIFPVIPWISLASIWMARIWQGRYFWLLFVIGIIMELWWSKPLGSICLYLILTAVAARASLRFWPVDARYYWILTSVVTVILFEIYLRII